MYYKVMTFVKRMIEDVKIILTDLSTVNFGVEMWFDGGAKVYILCEYYNICVDHGNQNDR